MVQVGDVGDGQAGRIEAMLPAGRAWSSDMLRTSDGDLTPHVFFVHQDPNVILDRHYHDAAEFQVVVGGSGKLRTHAVRPFTVHYASYQAVYGPLIASETGLDYITFRMTYQRGLFRFPDERRRMGGGQRSQVMGEFARCNPPSLPAAQVDIVIEPNSGGLAAWVLRLPPDAELEAPKRLGGTGRFLLLTNGSAHVNEGLFEMLSVAWIGNDDAAVAAGPAGAEMIVLQMPGHARDDIQHNGATHLPDATIGKSRTCKIESS